MKEAWEERLGDTGKALAFVAERKKLLSELIDPKEDIIKRNKRHYKKKSYWRKLSIVAGVSVEKKEEWKESDKEGNVTYFFTVRAILPDGQFMEGTGACSQNEQGSFDGDFISRSLHDTRATAETRAKNRAISDLLAFGEVTAEELNNWKKAEKTEEQTKVSQVVKPPLPKPLKLTSEQKGRSYEVIELLATVLPGTAEKLLEEQAHELKIPEEVEMIARKFLIHEMNEIQNQKLMTFEEMKKISQARFQVSSFDKLPMKNAVKLLLEIQEKVLTGD